MSRLFKEAHDAVRQATMGPGPLDRSAATRWRQLLHQASGNEREQIAFMAEALMAAAGDSDDTAFVELLLSLDDQLPAELVEQTVNLAMAEQRTGAAMAKAARMTA